MIGVSRSATRALTTRPNHDQESWKAPLPQFIEDLYLKRFGRERPEVVVSVEQQGEVVPFCRRRRNREKEPITVVKKTSGRLPIQ
jgi:hypothetical protein